MESSQSQDDAKGWKAHSGCKDLEILKAWVLRESLGDKTALLTVEGAISAILLGKYPSGTNNRSVLGSRHQNPCTIQWVLCASNSAKAAFFHSNASVLRWASANDLGCVELAAMH